ncbi:hypothetical protein GGTG_00305 [Gaeumannomyces tritici R3-111a-1]|uniref:Nudix hydrolase domain-containing protein n=1 Tax=Gaeumannomyces tritici (strain R3-111a-1) TaxID=644352 RepID=J3NGB3_GAET3|nr:hypothetical protein GGTG_00305 [Gaeumannomyces tritici R3-111a-1]EJT80303.1 hypothetical protein GGTG_00305 [Gaeumannomyces tritici R3-111a-1]
MMSTIQANTLSRPKYDKMSRMGTMGILVADGKVLLIHRRLKTRTIRIDGPPDSWSFPGGGLDEDETPEQAIVREMKEEIGLDVKIKTVGDEPVWGETDDFLEDDQWRCFFFVLELVDPEQKPKIMEPRKHVGLKWMEWKEMWAMISDDMAGKHKDDGSSERMRFFPSMKNMVGRYPKRSDPVCLEKRL